MGGKKRFHPLDVILSTYRALVVGASPSAGCPFTFVGDNPPLSGVNIKRACLGTGRRGPKPVGPFTKPASLRLASLVPARHYSVNDPIDQGVAEMVQSESNLAEETCPTPPHPTCIFTLKIPSASPCHAKKSSGGVAVTPRSGRICASAQISRS